MQQGVHQGAEPMAGGQMHDEAGRLIQHEEDLIFVENVE
jgi:hypothetical protein